MSACFDKVQCRRGSSSVKWNELGPLMADRSIFPFTIADVDFMHPDLLKEKLKDYVDTMVFGYTGVSEHYNDVVKGWMKRRHNWDVETEWLVLSSGIMPAIANAIQAFSNKGDGIVIMTPVYYPFARVITNLERRVIESPLRSVSTRYEIDFEDFELKMAQAKILLLCSPHNPVGRVWTKEELERIAVVAKRYDVLVVSDEIHFDICQPQHPHTVYAKIDPEQCIICTSPSKSFNLAGLQNSNLIIPNETIRANYCAFAQKSSVVSMNPNAFGKKATEIAYEFCEPWLDDMLRLVQNNHRVLKTYFAEHIPQVVVYDMEGTYLQWLDFRALEMEAEVLDRFLQDNCKLFFDDGLKFGENGRGFKRMNIACPEAIMLEGLKRLHDQLK